MHVFKFPGKIPTKFSSHDVCLRETIVINDDTLEENDDVELKVAQLRNDRQDLTEESDEVGF